jgi:SAM-dependent methyltransferase
MQACHETAEGFWSAEETEARVMLQARFLADVMAPGRLLDVGGASGAFARAAASLGWDCTVVDPAFSTAELGPHARIVRGSLESLPAGQTYDVVTLWAVIEHVPNYARVFAAAFAQLRPGGKLVMETLNYQSLDRLRTGRGWWGYQIDHRWYLSPGVYRDVALRVGFSDVQILRKVLRRFWQGEPTQIRPARTFLRRLLRRPLRVRSILHEYRAEHRARRRWPEWATLPLQTLVATKPIG